MVEISNCTEKHKRLKELRFENPTINLWVVVDRKLSHMEASYQLKYINTDKSLKENLKNIVDSVIKNANEISEYGYITVDQDNGVLLIEAEKTDFVKILDGINKGSDAESIQDDSELMKSWAYIIEITDDNNRLLAFKKLSKEWDLKKERGLNIIFKEQKFIDIKHNSIFRIHNNIDFIWFDKDIYIYDKKNFETGLNFRIRLTQNRDVALEEIAAAKIVDDIDIIKNTIGTKLPALRKIATIKDNAYFKREGFMEQLIVVNEKEKWGLEIEGKTIKVREDKIDSILTVLNNDRLKSLLTLETFDVPTKKNIDVNE